MGLRWWYTNGRPTDDPRLALLDEVWGRDGQLDWFAAWLWSAPLLVPFTSDIATMLGHSKETQPQLEHDRMWIDDRRRDAVQSGIPAPNQPGGSDMLHLSAHLQAPKKDNPGGVLLRSAESDRTAVLLLDSMVGWSRNLALRGSMLPLAGKPLLARRRRRQARGPPGDLPPLTSQRPVVLRSASLAYPRHLIRTSGSASTWGSGPRTPWTSTTSPRTGPGPSGTKRSG